MKVILQKFGLRLKRLRERTGISQEGFAVHCGLHRTAVGLLERGERIPRLDTLLILSRHLRVSLADFVRGMERWGAVRKSGHGRIHRRR